MRSDFKAYLLAHGAQDQAHSGGNLWQHLSGVHDILMRAGLSAQVCHAGLFHSVYGTQSFKHTTVDKSQRQEVQKMIGQEAEALAFAFAELPRPKLFEQALAISPTHIPEQILSYCPNAQDQELHQFYQDLLAIECANLIEQRVLHPFPRLARYAQTAGMLDEEGFPI